jgi:hypothetical protein
MWPPSHNPDDVKRRKVEPSRRASPVLQEADITHPRQGGMQQYPPWIGKQTQLTYPWSTNDRDAQTSRDYGIKQLPLLAKVKEQAFLDTVAWTNQDSQKASRQSRLHQGQQLTRGPQDRPRVKQEPRDEMADKALDLSVYRETNIQTNVRGITEDIIGTTDAADSRYRWDAPGEYLAKRSEVYSLKNMVDKTLSQQLPGNNRIGRAPAIRRNVDFNAVISNGNCGRFSRDCIPQNGESDVRHSFQKPGVHVPSYKNNPQDLSSLHSTTIQPADSTRKARILEQPSSSIGTGNSLVGNKHASGNLPNGGSCLTHNRQQASQSQPRETNTAKIDPTKDKTTEEEESEKRRKIEVPDMKMIAEGHSTLSHMLAGLVGYPLSLVMNMDFGDQSEEPDLKKTSTKRISKMGAILLSQFLTEGTDHYDKVWDMIKNEFDVSDEENVKSEDIQDDLKSTQKTLLRNFQHRLGLRERPRVTPTHIPNGSSDILGQLLSGFKCYDTELHKCSVINPKLDTDRDSEGESTYSCGSECSGCDSCRGHSRGDDAWERSFNLLPSDTLKENPIKTTEQDAAQRRYPLHTYRMALPARKRHIFMSQDHATLSIDYRNQANQNCEKKNEVLGGLDDKAHSESATTENQECATKRVEFLTDANGTAMEQPKHSATKDLGNNLTANSNTENSLHTDIESVGSSGADLTTDTDLKSLTADTISNGNLTQESDPVSSNSLNVLDLSNPRKRKVSLAINSIPSELLIENGSILPGADSGSPSSQVLDSSTNSTCTSSSSGDDESIVSYSKSIGLSLRMSEWSTPDVVQFITSIPGCETYGPVSHILYPLMANLLDNRRRCERRAQK